MPDVQDAVTAGMAALPLKVLADFEVDLGLSRDNGRQRLCRLWGALPSRRASS